MDRIKIVIAIFITVFFSALYAADKTVVANLASPVGYWKTIDEVSGRTESIVQIWQAQDGVLMGKIVKIFPKEKDRSKSLCTACQGSLRNQPIVGMTIISGLKPDEKHWGKGKILDPENGKTYSCKVKLADNGQRLNVHGYMGIPLLGRSQTWERVDLMAGTDRRRG